MQSLKTALREALRDGILDKARPAEFISISKEETEKDFLEFEEVKKLSEMPCPNEQTKRALLCPTYRL